MSGERLMPSFGELIKRGIECSPKREGLGVGGIGVGVAFSCLVTKKTTSLPFTAHILDKEDSITFLQWIFQTGPLIQYIRKLMCIPRGGANRVTQNWTTDNVPDLKGKVIIVTGANGGLGFEAAKEFSRKGAQTILACRSVDKGEVALARIQSEIPGAQAEIIKLDLISQTSIHKFANEIKAKYDHLDVLVNNAGISFVPYSKTEDGFESQLAINHLGHFALTGLLLGVILKTPGSRVVNISSVAHRFGSMDLDNLMFENGKDYSPARAYGRSKLANLLFTYELQRRFELSGSDAIAVAAHPGYSDTNLFRSIENKWFIKLLAPLTKRMTQSAAMGALPSIRAAVDPGVTGGQYYGPNGFMEQKGPPIVVDSTSASHNEVVARRLWEASEKLTGVYYTQLDNLRMDQKE